MVGAASERLSEGTNLLADGYGPGDGGGRGGEEKAACPAVAIGETYARSKHERQSECRFEYATVVLR
jgi:hypothetical protein